MLLHSQTIAAQSPDFAVRIIYIVSFSLVLFLPCLAFAPRRSPLFYSKTRSPSPTYGYELSMLLEAKGV